MVVYVVHRDLEDYPGKYVAKKWRAVDLGFERLKWTYVNEDLQNVRDFIEDQGVNCNVVSSEIDDDPTIVEIWI